MYDPNYPVCMHVYGELEGERMDCIFGSLAQCAASASGRPATCLINPYFAQADAGTKAISRATGSMKPGSDALMPVGRLANSRLLTSAAKFPSREHRPNQIFPEQKAHQDRAQYVQHDQDHNGV
jgi:hypothetical protein